MIAEALNSQATTTTTTTTTTATTKATKIEDNPLNIAVTCSETKCKTRNCTNAAVEGCSCRMCEVCCVRLQHKTKLYNQKKPIKPRVSE